VLDSPAAGRGPPADARAHACAAWLTNEVLPTPDRHASGRAGRAV